MAIIRALSSMHSIVLVVMARFDAHAVFGAAGKR
jgi:hypothetical protein